MAIYTCDNASCGKSFTTYTDVVIIKRGNCKYTLCNECAKKIIKELDKIISKDADINLDDFKINDDILRLMKEYSKHKHGKVYKTIQEYGEERLVKEFLSGTYTTQQLDVRLRVSNGSVANYLIHVGIKPKRTSTENNNNDKEYH